MRNLVLVAAVVATAMMANAASAQGGGAPAPAAPPPEVKRTVDAFVGSWTMEGTVTGVPGMKDAVKVKQTMVCKKAAGGMVASCAGNGVAAGLGKMEDVLLATYDAEGKAVRIVGMSSMGEVHDHKCAWKDDKTITCDPLAITAGGAPATVDLTATWPDAKSFTVTESTTTKDGSKMVFEGKGKRK